MSGEATVTRWWVGLRDHGVKVDAEHLDACRLIASVLEQEGRMDRLLATVQGVLTKSERDRAILLSIASDPATGETHVAEPPRARRKYGRRAAVAIALALLVVASIGYQVSQVTKVPPLPTTQRAASLKSQPRLAPPAGLRLTNAEQSLSLEIITPVDPFPPLVRALILAIPVLLILALGLYWRSRSPRWMDLPAGQVENRLYNCLPAAPGTALFQSRMLDTLGLSLTAAAADLSTRIDIERTVRATALNAGLLDVVTERPVVESPVHFAIQRRSRDDHIAELYHILAERVRGEGAYVQLTNFRQDLASRVDERGRRVGSPRPGFGEDRALILLIGDGENCFTVSGALDADQVNHVIAWPQRALLNIRPISLWGEREEALSAAQLAVAPASSGGLDALARCLERGEALTGLVGVRTRCVADRQSSS